MNINKTMISALLAVSAFGLTASMGAYADGKSDAEAACPGCHGVIIGVTQAVGSGGRKCTQRSESAWISTFAKMKSKGCNVVSGTEAGMAAYLACVENPACGTTTTTTATTASTTATTASTTATTASTTATTASTTATTDTTTATTGTVTATTDTTTATTASTTATTASTTASTTTTTMAGCNTYVNGTTQYKYLGKGSCHSFAEDLITGVHIVRDQEYCNKHKSHTNSKGNHVHAYPHPQCM